MSATAFQRRRREIEKQEELNKAHELALELNKLDDLKVAELKELAKEKEIKDYDKMKKEELINALRGA